MLEDGGPPVKIGKSEMGGPSLGETTSRLFIVVMVEGIGAKAWTARGPCQVQPEIFQRGLPSVVLRTGWRLQRKRVVLAVGMGGVRVM